MIDPNEFRELFQQNIQFHKHKGIDSPQIDANDLLNRPSLLGALFTGNVQVLLVGAGGGGAANNGGSFAGGGGGGGGLTYDAAHQVIAHIGADQAYPIVVGNPSISINSTFHTLTGPGGTDGTDTGLSTNAGGTGGVGTYATGGAGGAGKNVTAGGVGGNGGNGTAHSITGASVTYGGGGGGGGTTTPGTGGTGGGGNGNSGNNPNAGTGGGGGGTSGGSPTLGASGVVIIRYVTANFGPCTGGTITTVGSDTVHTFTSSGTFTVVAR